MDELAIFLFMSTEDTLPLDDKPTTEETKEATTMSAAADTQPTATLPTAKMEEPVRSNEIVFGVEHDVLVKFLKLFRDHYRKCEKATTFLETRTDIPNITSIANQRDAISHFKSALQPDTPREKRLEQYATAEEHFRRAIIEPYETALNKKMSLLIPVLQEYRECVLPVHDRHAVLLEYPNEKWLDQTLREIARLRDAARKAKGKNAWNDEWEEGVAYYIDGFEMANDLLHSLENAINKLRQIEKDEAENGLLKQLRDELAEKDAEIAKLKKAAGV